MCSMESIASIQGAGPLILDGGLATELEAQGFELQVSNRYLKVHLVVHLVIASTC